MSHRRRAATSRSRATVTRALIAAALIAATWSSAVTAADPGSTGSPPEPTKRPKTHQLKIDRATLDVPEALAQEGSVTCATPAQDPVPDGEPIVVSLPPAEPFTVGEIPASVWRQPWVTDPTWRLNFESLMWMRSLAQRAADDGQVESLDVLVSQAAAFFVQNPDPGMTAYGWDEGTTARRLDALTCLYALTRDERLVSGMNASAAVLLGPRYYGPPTFPVHNHGVYSNITLIRAAGQLGTIDWRNTAVARIEYETPLAFTSRGTTWEQSSHYHQVTAVMWNRAANAIGPGPAADAIRANTARAASAYRWMTEPDGRIVQIGESDLLTGVTGGAGATFRDDQAGWLMGRWSWSDARTTYYTIRYGPPRRAHGQQDRGGVTWTTLGVRVLVSPGRYTSNGTSPWFTYTRSGVSHNVAIPGGLTLRTGSSAWVRSGTVSTSAHVWNLGDALYGRSHYRTVNVSHASRTLRVSDSFSGTGVFRQYWQLHSAWRLRARNEAGTWLRFTNGHGRTLTITTTGRFSSMLRGQTSPVAGWSFPALGSRVPADQLTLRSYTPMTTTFVVT
jgi:hypothetical protein